MTSPHLPSTPVQSPRNVTVASALKAAMRPAPSRSLYVSCAPIAAKGRSYQMAAPGRYQAPHSTAHHKAQIKPHRITCARCRTRAWSRSAIVLMAAVGATRIEPRSSAHRGLQSQQRLMPYGGAVELSHRVLQALPQIICRGAVKNQKVDRGLA